MEILEQALPLAELLDRAELVTALAGGYVRQQIHPTQPLAVLNYTERAAYENAWTATTRTCRGLIYDTRTDVVVARPLPKFFNYGQPGAAVIDLSAPVHVTDKADGSLGILYPLPSGGFAVATRGSFTSEQAQHATELWRHRYADRFTPPPGTTVLVEIVYPGNRIVLDYGDLDDLLLLGAVDNWTGGVLTPEQVPGWPGPTVATFSAATFADALALPPRSNAEGIVVRCLYSDNMVKIKQEDYVALHRIVTGLNARTVWEHLTDGKPLADLIAPLPDEFHDWVRRTAYDLHCTVMAEWTRLAEAYKQIIPRMPTGWNPVSREGRKAFAAVAAGTPDSWAMFQILDGRDIRPELWRRARPEATTPSGHSYSEDTA